MFCLFVTLRLVLVKIKDDVIEFGKLAINPVCHLEPFFVGIKILTKIIISLKGLFTVRDVIMFFYLII